VWVAPAPAAEVPAYVFGEVEAGHPEQRLRTVLGDCDDSGCRIDVQLLEKDTLLDSRALPWRAPQASPARAPLDLSGGVGDPMQPNVASQAATVGEENGAVTVYVESVRLGAAGQGLLVHLIAGFEHIKRSRQLFVAAGQKLASAWQHEEAQGPARTLVEVIDVNSDGADELRTWTFTGPDWLLVDSVHLETLSWDADRQLMRARPPASLISSVVLREFGNEEAARAGQRQLGATCPEWMLFAPRTFGSASAKYWIGALTAHPELMEQALARARQCAPRWSPQRQQLPSAKLGGSQD
jgi:hypothetical protein